MEVLFLFSSLVVALALAGCPTSWTQYESSCYALFHSKLTFSDAATECKVYGNGSLAELETTLENTELKSFLNSQNTVNVNGVWIGGGDMLTEGIFRWDKSQKEISYYDWHAGQPDDTSSRSQDCLAMFKMFSFEWADHYCTEKMAFLCELPATP